MPESSRDDEKSAKTSTLVRTGSAALDTGDQPVNVSVLAAGAYRRLAPLAAAFACGYGLYFTFPPHLLWGRSLWWAAPLWAAALLILLNQRRERTKLRRTSGFGLGYAFGLGFFLPLLSWTGIYVGSPPWLALSAFLSLSIGLFGWLAVRVAGPPAGGEGKAIPGGPFWTACAWTACEWLRGSWPFGGFPWGRLAFGQAGGLLAPAAALGGASLLSFVVVFLGALLAHGAGWLNAGRRNVIPGLPARTGVAVAASITLVFGSVLLGRESMPRVDGGARLIVAAVQGGVPKLGLDFNDRPAAVLMNHVNESLELARQEAAGLAPHAQLVVWPENASDIDPVVSPTAGERITGAARSLGAPLLVGTLDYADEEHPHNTVLVWDPLLGPQDRHDKVILQPFGEYMPLRGFFRLFSPQVDRAGRFEPGNGNGVVRVRLTDDQTLLVGVATCYEVIFDRALVGAVRGGAQILAVPSNNATFGDSDMTYQQLAASRVRAVELGRTVVVSATTGVSAIIGPDGQVTAQTGKIKPGWLVAEVPLRSDRTPASYVLPWFDVAVLVLALAGLVWGIRRGREASAKSPVSDRGSHETDA